ncbi:hypothetical protein [Paenibacillus herberti]|uniref:Glycosyltransferase RgtA/B/C/D-like domain-containing protein n=1 Tax=Paenibacillus herberti TaxID=1619309 RepID=A0A229P2L7_9BACL|nr:hypothetical protein [Paenibacillus herberti]OXM16536.1 hypothetical protein CGZ75_07665 [Paenibacillus herberti]
MHGRLKNNVKPASIIAAVAVLAAALVVIVALFVKPYLGMADNGDFFREIHNPGLYYLNDTYEDRHFGYFNREYGIREYPYEAGATFISSLSLFIRGAIGLDLLFTGDNRFDLRVLAVIYTLMFLAAIYLIVRQAAERMPALAACGAAALAIVFFADSGYIAYFNSFYGEPASYVALLLTMALLMRLPDLEKGSVRLLVTWVVAASLFAAAKQQNAPSGLLLALLGVRLAFLYRPVRMRRLALGGSVVIALVSILTYVLMTDDIKHINQYHAVTRGILEGSLNPERDLEELGLDPKFSVLAGTTYYDKYKLEPVESELMQEEFYSKFGYLSIMRYYVLHADRALQKLNQAASQAYYIRPQAMGNYEQSVGKEFGAKTSYFSFWSSIKPHLFPGSFRFIVLFYFIFYGGLVYHYVAAWRGGRTGDRFRLEALALPGLIGLSQLGVSFLGAGDADLAKHLFLYDVCFDLMFGIMVVYALNSLNLKLKLRRKAGNQPWKSKSSTSGSSSLPS